MTDPTAAFFEDLRSREYEPLLARKKGTVRVEVTNGRKTDHWLVVFDDGTIEVSNRDISADATLRADASLFDRIVSGEANAVSAVLRGALSLDGDWNVLVVFQRLFPSPPHHGSRS
jgi:putative sterol carrier protein